MNMIAQAFKRAGTLRKKQTGAIRSERAVIADNLSQRIRRPIDSGDCVFINHIELTKEEAKIFREVGRYSCKGKLYIGAWQFVELRKIATETEGIKV